MAGGERRRGIGGGGGAGRGERWRRHGCHRGEIGACAGRLNGLAAGGPVSYKHLRAHETVLDLVCRLLL